MPQHGLPSEFTVYATWDSENEKELVLKEREQMEMNIRGILPTSSGVDA